MLPEEYCGRTLPEDFYPMCKGFIGETTTIAFKSYVQDYEIRFNAEDVLNKWEENKKLINNITNDKKNDLISQIVTYSKSNELTLKQAENACKFASTCSDEMIVSFMNYMMETGNIPNIRKVHKHIAKKVVDIVNTANSQRQ